MCNKSMSKSLVVNAHKELAGFSFSELQNKSLSTSRPFVNGTTENTRGITVVTHNFTHQTQSLGSSVTYCEVPL